MQKNQPYTNHKLKCAVLKRGLMRSKNNCVPYLNKNVIMNLHKIFYLKNRRIISIRLPLCCFLQVLLTLLQEDLLAIVWNLASTDVGLLLTFWLRLNQSRGPRRLWTEFGYDLTKIYNETIEIDIVKCQLCVKEGQGICADDFCGIIVIVIAGSSAKSISI